MIKSSNILSDITPLNDLYYKSCFFTSLFTAINHYDEDISAIILNDMKTFEYKIKEGTLDYRLQPCEEIDRVIMRLNLSMKSEKINNDLLGDLHDVIDNKGIAIIMVDSYYESIRKDAYMKHHIPHSLLCFGYDDEMQEVYIVEHFYKDSLTYEKMVISYQDITNSYQGYLTNYYQEDGYPTYYEIHRDQKINQDIRRDPKYEYLKNMNRNKNVLMESLAQFSLFQENFEGSMYSESVMNKSISSILESIVNIVNIRKVENFALHKVFDDDQILKEHDNSLAYLEKVKKLLAKYMYSLKYDEILLEKVVDCLKESYESDYGFFHSIWNYHGKEI